MKRRLFAVALLALVAAPSWAASSCSTTVTLKHVGKLPKAAMGHNIVIAATADEQGVLADGGKAGLENNYVKPGDNRVIAHTKVIGGGEADSATFKVAALKPGQDYSFFCSFPGHAALMKGTVSLAK
jgi:azurin